MILLFLINFLFAGGDSILVKKTEIKNFANAVSITSDAKDNIYILDATANQIVKYNSRLEFIKRNGKLGWGDQQFDSPTYIDGSSGLDIFISDGNNKRVMRYDLNLIPIAELKTNLIDFPVDLRFSRPIASLVLNSNQLFVIDGDNQRLVVYNDGRNPSSVFGNYNSGKGRLLRPEKLLKDGQNNIYVLDREVNNILKYDNLGNYVNTISIENLVTFAIYGNTLYMLNGKEIILYDLEKNIVSGKKIISDSSKKNKFRDILILNDKKYLLLGKNTLSLYQEN
jgi:hypothetical protein